MPSRKDVMIKKKSWINQMTNTINLRTNKNNGNQNKRNYKKKLIKTGST